jgi:hypothetical protein
MPGPTHREDVPDVPELLRRHLDRTGEKQSDIVARANRAGYKITRQTISKLTAQGPKESPKDPDTIRALAAGLQVTEKEVWLAYGRSLGLDITQAELGDRMDPAADLLPDDIQDAFLLLVRATARHAANGRHDTPPPPLPEERYTWPEESAPSGQRSRIHKTDDSRTRGVTRRNDHSG